jgi:hypothetical protein
MLFDSIISGLNQLALDLAGVEQKLAQAAAVQLVVEMNEVSGEVLAGEVEAQTNPLGVNAVAMLPLRATSGVPTVAPTNLSLCIKDDMVETQINVASV